MQGSKKEVFRIQRKGETWKVLNDTLQYRMEGGDCPKGYQEGVFENLPRIEERRGGWGEQETEERKPGDTDFWVHPVSRKTSKKGKEPKSGDIQKKRGKGKPRKKGGKKISERTDHTRNMRSLTPKGRWGRDKN